MRHIKCKRVCKSDTYCRGATELVTVCEEFVQNDAVTPDI